MILWKFSANKGDGSCKFIVNPVNVEKPQSLRHVQPICKFTANYSRENMHTTMFDENSPHKVNVEDTIHWRSTLINVRIGNEMRVALVKNSNPTHHRHKPMSLTDQYIPCEYTPVLPATLPELAELDDRAALVYFSNVKSIKLMSNKACKQFEGLCFIDGSCSPVDTWQFKTSTYQVVESKSTTLGHGSIPSCRCFYRQSQFPCPLPRSARCIC